MQAIQTAPFRPPLTPPHTLPTHPERHGLKLGVHLGLELLLQPVAVEAEEALQPVVVLVVGILPGQAHKVLVHALVVVVAHEVAPEAEQRVHLLGQTVAWEGVKGGWQGVSGLSGWPESERRGSRSR